jgi:hypothetical protein
MKIFRARTLVALLAIPVAETMTESNGYSQAQGTPAGLLDQVAAALNAPADCSSLKRLWTDLNKTNAIAKADKARAESLRARLFSRRRELGCLHEGGTGGPPPPTINAWSAYEGLLKDVEKRRAACATNAPCEGLTVHEEELIRITLVNIRDLPLRDPRRLALEKNLGEVFSPVIPLRTILTRLGTASEKDREAFLDMAVELSTRQGQGKASLDRVERVVSKLEANKVSSNDVDRVLDAAIALHLKSGGSQSEVDKRFFVSQLVQDAHGRLLLEKGLHQLERQHPYIRSNNLYVQAEQGLRSGLPPDELFRSFMRLLDKALFADMEYAIREAAGAPVRELRDERAVLLFVKYPSAKDQREKASTLTKSFFQRSAGSVPAAVRPFEEVTGDEEVKNLARLTPLALRLDSASRDDPSFKEFRDLCRGPDRTGYRRLCDGPYSHVIFVRFENTPPSSAMPVVDCWSIRGRDVLSATAIGVPGSEVTTNAADVDVETTGTVLASHALDACRIPTAPAGGQLLQKGNAWTALAFAGTPFLVDGRSRRWPKTVFSALDAGFLIAGAGALGMGVHYRNEYADGGSRSLDRADASLIVGVSCLGAMVLTRIVGALIYHYSPGTWCDGPSCHEDAP